MPRAGARRAALRRRGRSAASSVGVGSRGDLGRVYATAMNPPTRLPSHPSVVPLRACLMSNGRYTVMTRDTGSGFSRWRDSAVTRWREDPSADRLGTYLAVRNRATGATWSATAQPLGG